MRWPGPVRILLDTNIMVSGFLSPKGPPGRLVRGWLQGRFELVTSREQLRELARVLGYEHLRSRIDRMQAQAFVENVDSQAIVATDLPTLTLSPDPSDNVILATAVAGKAAAVVSGDKADILSLCEVEGIPIMTARGVLEFLGMAEE